MTTTIETNNNKTKIFTSSESIPYLSKDIIPTSSSQGIDQINSDFNPLSKSSTITIRTDAYGHIISKGRKSYKVTFADQDKKEKLVDIIYIDDNSSAVNDIKTTAGNFDWGTPKKPLQPINISDPINEPKYTIKRPKKYDRKRWEKSQSLEKITEKVDTQCCTIF